MSAKSITQPVAGSRGPRTCSSMRNECPCRRAHLWPGGTCGRRWAASMVNSLKISIGVSLSGNAEQLMRLQAESPLRMLQAIAQSEFGVFLATWAIHWLQEEVPEVQMLEALRLCSLLREDELQFLPGLEDERCARLGTHANPINAGRRQLRAVGFDGNLKALGVQCPDQRFVKLEQRLAPGADDEALRLW